jgi:GNAT superfamily N-acetyltransferase
MESAIADIRLLTPADLEGAFALSSTAGWNQRPADWRMLLRLAPHGSYAAVDGGRIVGTAIGIHYGTFGWIAMMLVDPVYRGRGLGARLLEAALGRGRGLGARLLEAALGTVPAETPIRLDATPLGRPLYQRYGFVDEEPLTRHVSGGDRPRRRGAALHPGSVREPSDADLGSVGDLDREVFGGDRRALLEWSRGMGSQFARVAQNGPEGGYCFGREGRLFDQIGPVIAPDDEAAQALVAAALIAAGDRPVIVDAFDAHARFASWLGGAGFVAQRPLFRMARPAPGGSVEGRTRRGALTEFAIFGPEFA